MVRQARIVLAVVIALLLGSGCTWVKSTAYKGFKRDEWQQPARVIQSLAIQPGEIIADLGAGSGYFTFRLADAAGPKGNVFAVDVDQAKLTSLAEKIEKQGYQNIETLFALSSNPRLPEGGVDIIFLCNVYHHLKNHIVYFKEAKKYLSPDGRIAIIDYHKGSHSTPGEVILKDMIDAGYSLQIKHDYLEKQNFQIFTPN